MSSRDQMTKNNALRWAVGSGDQNRVREALKEGAEVNAQDQFGGTPLLLAINMASQGDGDEMMKALIDAGADLEVKDREGRTPLMWAAERGYEGGETVKVLIEAGADLEARDEDGRTALMKAAERGFGGCVKALIDGGADIEAKYFGWTPLMMALSAPDEGETVKVLIEGGADIETRDRQGLTVTDLAKGRSPKCLEIIQTARASCRAAELDLKLNQACDSWSPPEASSSTHKGPQAQQEKLTQAEHQAPVARSRQRF